MPHAVTLEDAPSLGVGPAHSGTWLPILSDAEEAFAPVPVLPLVAERPRWEIGLFKEPVSALTHFVGFLAAVWGTWHLVVSSGGDPWKTGAMGLYGVSLALVFLASTTFHFFDLGEPGNRVLRHFDHSAIFLVIAGSYLPPLLHLLEGTWRLGMVAAVGTLSMLGMVLKVACPGCPRWLGTTIYLLLGWLVVIPSHLIFPQLDPMQIGLLVSGGLAFTLGSFVYVTDRPDPFPEVFGAHEIWHVFVLVGAAAHFWFMTTLVDLPYPPI